MLLVKDDTYVKKLKRVMVAIDKSEASQESLELALSLVKNIDGSQIFLTHINPDQRKLKEAPLNPEQDPALTAAVELAKRQGVAYRCVTSSGKAGPELCRLAEEMNIDLLLLGSPDRRPSIAKTLPDLDRLLGNSLSDYVRVYANCPVLLTRTIA
jgi:nucleotide-binding universal stress UspA family protein